MMEVSGKAEDGKLIIAMAGRVDSLNASQAENAIGELTGQFPGLPIVLDCDRLEHSTSAGLRVILRLMQRAKNVIMINVHSELYDILEMTGFTDMMEIQKAYRVLSVEGCELIGEGANGKVYRVDRDTIVKVYRKPDAIQEIHRERELARTAFVAGVPTAIPYDVVRIREGGYGSVFELLDATSYAGLLLKGEKTLDEVAGMSAQLLKTIHSRTARADLLPDMKKTAVGWIQFLQGYLPEKQRERLLELIGEIPDSLRMLHGDFHVKNIMLQNNESLLIDMDTLCCGDPVFELAAMYNAYVGFGVIDPSLPADFFGFSYETCNTLWSKTLALYLDTTDSEILQRAEDKAKLIGIIRIMRRLIRHQELETDTGRRMMDYCRKELTDLLPRVDSLAVNG